MRIRQKEEFKSFSWSTSSNPKPSSDFLFFSASNNAYGIILASLHPPLAIYDSYQP